ncbi:hypothetical protein [Myroides profundi]|uniref:Uncharacterized protein n=1 Tax=Myroides profundi TaxID=480520 RepID=A0AAJ4W2M5_MYRPR|nr:hypothetical protein [Myroides profundi]AJH16420.1 hypothetical protein MPR_3300 [Myroides profundi]SEQ55789.1 hypothetical protein SAMN04488089_10455 [Myroides profundi]
MTLVHGYLGYIPKIEKVGPTFDNIFGWNVIYTISNKQTMVINPSKWK